MPPRKNQPNSPAAKQGEGVTDLGEGAVAPEKAKEATTLEPGMMTEPPALDPAAPAADENPVKSSETPTETPEEGEKPAEKTAGQQANEKIAHAEQTIDDAIKQAGADGVTVFIDSRTVEYYAETENGITRKYLEGSINGKHYKVELDKKVVIPVIIAKAINDVIKRSQAYQAANKV